MDFAELGEFGLIARWGSRLHFRSPNVKIGIGDDCAVYECAGDKYQVVTADALLEKVHFNLATISAEQLGRKALSVNISDVAAMGGIPVLALISLGIPRKLTVKFLDAFYDGLDQVSRKYGVELAGGDTVASPELFYINVTVLGEARKDRLFTRRGARPGDKILVTGSLGDSALGLKLLRSPRRHWSATGRDKKAVIEKHLDPEPRMAESRMLAGSDAEITSMIDISDGLVQDLGHICAASGVGADLYAGALPQSAALKRICGRNRLDCMEFVLSGGEDYELLFTTTPEDVKKITERSQKAEAPMTVIGEIVPEPGKLSLVAENGRREPIRRPRGYDHFKRGKKG